MVNYTSGRQWCASLSADDNRLVSNGYQQDFKGCSVDLVFFLIVQSLRSDYKLN